MKLHLPKGLRAALIAAIATIGFTLPQAYAATVETTMTTTFSNCAQSDALSVGTANVFGNTDVLNPPSSSITALYETGTSNAVSLQTQGAAGPVADFLTPNTNVGNDHPWTMEMSYTGAETVQSITGMTLSVGLFNASGAWQGSGATWTGDVTFTATITAGDQTATYTGLLFNGSGGGQGQGEAKFPVTLSGGTIDLSGVSEYTLKLELTETLATGTFVGLQNIGYSVVASMPEIGEYTWEGTSGTHTWSGAVWNDGEASGKTFTDGSDVIFGATGYKEVDVTNSPTARFISVNADGYTFKVEAGQTLSGRTLTIADGCTLTVGGEGALDITGQLAGGGTLALGSSLAPTVSELTIAADKTFTVSGEGALLSVTTISNAGTLNIGEGARVASSGSIISVGATSPFTVTGLGTLAVDTLRSTGGTINISSNMEISGGDDGKGGTNNSLGLSVTGDNGTVNILAGTTMVTGATYTGNANNMQLNVGTGSENATLVTRRLELGDRNGGTGSFTIGQHGTVVITGNEDFRDGTNPQKNTSLQLSEWNQVVTSSISGKLYAQNATAFMSNDTSSVINITGGTMAVKGIATTNAASTRAHTLTMTGGKLVLGEMGLAAEAGAWTVSFANAEIGTYAGSTVVGRNFTIDGNVTFNTAMYTWTGEDASLDLLAGEAGGAITVSGSFSGDGTIIKTGDGTLMLAGDNNALTHTINLQAGTLDVTTAVLDISDMEGITTKGYSDGQVAGNGFATMGGTVDVVKVGAGATLSREGVQVLFNGVAVDMDDNGDVTVADSKSLITFYVNEDGSAESLNNAVTKGEGQLTTVNLADNTTLTADADTTLGSLLVRENASATVSLSQDLAVDTVTVTTAGETLTLSGAGVLSAGALQGAGDVVIGTGTTLALNGIGTGYAGSFTANEGGTLQLTTNSLPEILTVNGDGTLRMMVSAGGQNIDPQKVVAKNVVLAADEQHNSRFRYVTATDLSEVEHLSFEGGQLWLNGKDMTGTNAFAGDVTFGTTVYSEGNAFGGAALRVDRNGTFTGAVEVKENTKFTWGANMTVEFAGTVTGSGNLELARYNGNGTFKVSGDASEYAGAMTSHANVALSVEADAKLTLAGGSNLSGAVTIGGELTMNSAESTTSTIGGSISGSGTLNKAGAGTLEVSGAAAATSTVAVNVNEGTLKVSAANALGSGDITVATGATLDLVNGGALGTAQTVANGGNVLLHSTLTQGTVNGGTLTLASDFPVDGDILDVEDSDTGNGFSQGGTAQVYDTANATLSDDIDIVHGETHYALTDLTDGAITLSGADWNTYQLNVDAQYAVQDIMDYAAGKGGELKTISVNADMLTIENDSTTLKTSMLGGEHLATFAVYMSGTSGLTIDADCPAYITANAGAEGTLTLEKDATIGSLTAADAMTQEAIQLTITGKGHTLKTDGLAVAFDGTLVLDEGVKLEMLPETAFTSINNANMVLKKDAVLVMPEVTFATVEGGDEAKVVITSDDYLPMYDARFTEYSITGARITYTTSANFDLGHVIDATSQVVNAGTGSLRDISTNEKYAELNAQGGDIYISTPLDSGIETRALIVGDLTLANGRTVAEDTGKTVSITVNGTAGFGSGATLGAALTMAGGSTLNGQAALANHSLALGTTTGDKLAIGADLWSTLSGLSSLESMNLFTGVSALTLAGKEYTEDVDLSTIFTHDSLKAKKYMLGYDAAGKNVTITRLADNNRYWTGGNGTWDYTNATVWTDEDGAPAAFSSGYNAYFAAANGGTVTLGTDITAESITVSGADYTFEPGTHSLTVNKSVEADGHKATFNMTLSGADLKLIAKNGGAITLANGGSVKDVEVGAGSTVSATASLTVTGGFTNAGQVNVNTLTLNQGTTAGGNATVTTLELASGQSYTFGNLTANSVNGAGANLTIGTGNTLQVNSSATIGNLALANGAQLASSGTTTVSGTTAINTAASLVGSLTTGALSGTGTLTLNNGSLTFTEATTLTDTDLAFSGTSTITSQDVTLTFKGTLVHTVKGAMTFVGSFDVGNCDTVDGTAVYVEGGSTDNGFKQAQKIVSIINGGSANGTNATLTYNGKSIGKMDTDGKVQFQGDTEYDKYYVNTGSEFASKALDNPNQQLGTFELAAGTKLVVDKNISMGMVNAAGAANMQIASGSTVTTDGTTKALTLAGAGTLAVDAGKTTTGVTLGDTYTWNGTVSFTEAGLNTLAAAWGNADSTVALQDTYGSLGTAEVDYDLELRKGTGSNWGFGATATGDSMLTLNGDLKGAGDFGVKAGTGSSIFILKGSTGDWTGNFVDNSAAGGSTTLVLDSAEKVIHGMVGAVSPGGELFYASNLEVTTVANTTFEKAVQVARLISMSGTTKLQENSTVGTLSNTANLELAANKTLTIREQLSYGTSSGIFKMGAHSQVALAENATMGYLGDYKACYKGGTVTNGTDEQQTYSLDNADITATDTTLQVQGNTSVTVGNKLVNATLSVETPLQASVVLNNVQDSLEVAGNLAIGNGGSLKVAKNNGADKQTLNIGSGTLTTGIGSAVDADLTLAAGVTTDMAAALDLNGGALTLAKGLTLAGGLYDAVDALSEDGAYVNLFQNVGALTLGADTYTQPVKALQYFTNLSAFSDRGDYFLKYDGGIVSIYFTPTDARTLTWDGTETEHRWTQDDTVTDWLVGDPATETYFGEGDNARFTGDAEKKLVTIAEDITARNITIADSRYTIENDADRTITADQFVVNNAALGKKGDGKLVLAVDTPVSLENAAFAVQAGDVEIGAADSAGALELTASMLDIAPGSTLTVATITADTDSTIELDGTLQVAKGSVMYIEASEGSLLKIADVGTATAGTLAVNTDAYLYGLENHGTLDLGTNELTLMEKTAQGGNVTAGKLTLAENGSTFGDLKVNTIQYGLKAADDATLDAENPNLVVDSIAAGGVFPVVTLDISETMHGEGSLAPIQRTGEEVTYTLLHANDGLGTTSFTLNTGALDLLKQNGLLHADAGLVKTENDVTLTVGGLDLTWYTDKDVTEWGYNVVSNDSITHGGNTLNGVEHVVVDASRTIDVTGAGSEPGLRVRNITGLDGRTLAFTGTEDDTVNLVTNVETSSNVGLAAENITLKVGLDELDDMDPVDYKDLRVGDVTLTGATLDVHAHEGLDDSFTVNTLNGDADSLLKGSLLVEGQGGAYRGEYENAYVGLHEDAVQSLYADEGLTIAGTGTAKLAYSDAETHMDGIEGIGMTVVLNDTKASNIGATLVLDNASWLVEGTLVTGMSAAESALTLDTPNVPDLLDAPSMSMDGTTVIINQTADDDANIAMAVNDGGYKRGLLLAYIGADNSYTDNVVFNGHLYNKYYTNARLQGGKVLVDRNRSFYTDITAPTSENGQAGAGMLDDALLYNNPQVTNPTGDLAAVMTALEKGGYTKSGADKVMAAMSGASHAAMGAAWNRDVDRQLRAIRNRTTQMGLAECTHHEGLPYFNAWINAEGDYSKLDADGTLAGYKLTSWGGTLGVDVDCTNRFTMGVAVTAMSGDFTANSVERAEGDLDRLYVSVFGRYTHRAWTHTFVATYGMADTKLKRTVDYTYGSYNTDSSSDGKAFGLMYELGYVTALNEDSSTCLQPVLNLSYRHSSLAGCSEQSSSDAALRLGNADANVFTAAIGARLQSAVGTSVYNRASIFEGRVMLKFDTGDRDVSARNGFLGVPGGRDAKSTEAGLFGVEVGVGLTIPLSENAGALFFDVTGDFRAKDTEVNGTVGYRYNF